MPLAGGFSDSKYMVEVQEKLESDRDPDDTMASGGGGYEDAAAQATASVT